MNIYVGNLSQEVSEEELQEAFGAYGKISSANVIKDKFNGRSRGFGFVNMDNDEEAQKAISELNGKQLGGQAIKVNEARPRSNNSNRRRRDSGYGRRY